MLLPGLLIYVNFSTECEIFGHIISETGQTPLGVFFSVRVPHKSAKSFRSKYFLNGGETPSPLHFFQQTSIFG